MPRMPFAERVWRSLAPTRTRRRVIGALLLAYLVVLTLVVLVGGHLWFLLVAPVWTFAVGELRRSFMRRNPGGNDQANSRQAL